MKQLVLDADMACAVCESVIWRGSRAFGNATDRGEPVVCPQCYRNHVQAAPLLPVPPTSPEHSPVAKVAA